MLTKISIDSCQLKIWVLASSQLDARLEAEQCRPDRQIYADGRFGVSIAPGDTIIDVGANVGRWGGAIM